MTAVLAAGTVTRILTAASILTIIAITAGITVRHVVPINARMHYWDPANPPVDWAAVRDRWYHLHHLRTAGFALALILQLLADQPPT